MTVLDSLGFSVDTSDLEKAITVLEKVGRAGDDAAKGIKKQGDASQDASGKTRQHANATDVLKKAYAGLAGVIASIAFAALIKDIVETTLKFQGMEAALKAATGSAQGAATSMAFIREEANRLGLNLETAAEGFTQIAAAAKGTALEGKATQEIFSAISEASVVMNLSADETQGALLAISQMMSKGVVSAEELRGQLGERLPGSFQIAARAMGVTTEELGKMLETGSIIADDFLPKFAREVQNTFGAALPDAVEGARADFARLENAITELVNAIGESGLVGAIATLAQWFTTVINQTRLWLEEIGLLEDSFNRMQVAELVPRKEIEAMKEIEAAMESVQENIDAVLERTDLSAEAQQKALDGLHKSLSELNKQYDEAHQAVKRATRETETYTGQTGRATSATGKLTTATRDQAKAFDDVGDEAGEVDRVYNELIQTSHTLDDAERENLKTKEAVSDQVDRMTEQADPYRETWENAVRGIQGAFSTFFETVLSEGIADFGSLVEAIKQLFIRMIAEMAAYAVANPIIVAMGLGSPGQAVAGGAVSGLLGGFNPLGSVVGGIGRLAGGALGLLGGAADLTGAVGAAGAAPFMLSPLGIGLGALGIGGLLLGGLGGLFGGKPNEPPSLQLAVHPTTAGLHDNFGVRSPFGGQIGFAASGTTQITTVDFMPFIAALQGVENAIADFLTPEEIEAIDHRLRMFEGRIFDQDALNSASLGFDMAKERFVDIFREIDPAMADLVQDFEGTFQELVHFTVGLAELHANLRDNGDVLARYGGTMELAAEHGWEMVNALNAMVEYFQADLIEEYGESLDANNQTLIQAIRDTTPPLLSLISTFGDTGSGATELATALAQRYQMELQMIDQIRTAIEGVAATTATTVENINLAMMTADEQLDYILNQRIPDLQEQLAISEDPAEITQLTQEINRYIMQAFGLATPEQQAVMGDMLIGIAEDVGSQATQRLNELELEVIEEHERTAQALKDAMDSAFNVGAREIEEAIVDGGEQAGQSIANSIILATTASAGVAKSVATGGGGVAQSVNLGETGGQVGIPGIVPNAGGGSTGGTITHPGCPFHDPFCDLRRISDSGGGGGAGGAVGSVLDILIPLRDAVAALSQSDLQQALVRMRRALEDDIEAAKELSATEEELSEIRQLHAAIAQDARDQFRETQIEFVRGIQDEMINRGLEPLDLAIRQVRQEAIALAEQAEELGLGERALTMIRENAQQEIAELRRQEEEELRAERERLKAEADAQADRLREFGETVQAEFIDTFLTPLQKQFLDVIRAMRDSLEQAKELGASERELMMIRATATRRIEALQRAQEAALENFMEGIESQISQLSPWAAGDNISKIMRSLRDEMAAVMQQAADLGAGEQELARVRQLYALKAVDAVQLLMDQALAQIAALRDTLGADIRTIRLGQPWTDPVVFWQDEINRLRAEMGSATDLDEQLRLADELRRAILARMRAEEAAHNQEMEHINDRAAAELESFNEAIQRYEALARIAEQLAIFVDTLGVSPQSPLTPAQRLQEAERIYRETLAAAEGGDVDAAARLQQAAQTYLQEAFGYYRSSDDYVNIFNQVQRTLGDLVDVLPGTRPGYNPEEYDEETREWQTELERIQYDALRELEALDRHLATIQDRTAEDFRATMTEVKDELLTALVDLDTSTISGSERIVEKLQELIDRMSRADDEQQSNWKIQHSNWDRDYTRSQSNWDRDYNQFSGYWTDGSNWHQGQVQALAENRASAYERLSSILTQNDFIRRHTWDIRGINQQNTDYTRSEWQNSTARWNAIYNLRDNMSLQMGTMNNWLRDIEHGTRSGNGTRGNMYSEIQQVRSATYNTQTNTGNQYVRLGSMLNALTGIERNTNPYAGPFNPYGGVLYSQG